MIFEMAVIPYKQTIVINYVVCHTLDIKLNGIMVQIFRANVRVMKIF